MNSMTRQPGWESRLAAVIEGARGRPYVLGEWDCFRLACAVVQALTGLDRWPAFAGSYSTKREALRRIAEHGSSFADAASWFFGGAAIAVALARKGDIASCRDGTGEFHLGVVYGAKLLVLSPEGLTDVPRSAAVNAWRVG